MKALLFWWDENHWPLAREALKEAGRMDLIGRAPACLIPPDYGVTAQKGPNGLRRPSTPRRRPDVRGRGSAGAETGVGGTGPSPMNTNHVTLDRRGLDYIRSTLEATNHLGRIVLSSLEWDSGKVIGVIPRSHAPDIYEFKEGLFRKPQRERKPDGVLPDAAIIRITCFIGGVLRPTKNETPSSSGCTERPGSRLRRGPSDLSCKRRSGRQSDGSSG